MRVALVPTLAFAAFAALMNPRLAHADGPGGAPAAPALCTDVSGPKGAIEARKGKWIQLTPEQLQFMRGVFVLNPNTPPGLPFGDKAVLAQVDGDAGGLIFFIDGDRACTPMAVPAILVSMMNDVGEGTISHELPSN